MAASAERDRLAIEAEAFRAEMNRRHLGHYTYEQEADEISMELLASAGLDPREHVEAWLGFTKALYDDPESRSSFDGDAIAFDECQKLFHDDWKRDGQPVFIPLGAITDPHHGFCYRLFNLSREIRAHAYEPRGRGPAATVPWATVQTRAKEALAALLAAPVPAPSASGSSSGEAPPSTSPSALRTPPIRRRPIIDRY